MVRTQGTPQLTSRVQVEEPVPSILSSVRVEGVWHVSIQEAVAGPPVRASRGKRSVPRQIWSVQVHAHRDQQAIERAMTTWKSAPVGDAQAIRCRLSPLDVQRDDHRVGLMRLLTIALRVVTVLEGVVRQALAEQAAGDRRTWCGHSHTRTAQPTTERLLEAFHERSVTMVSGSGFVQRPLSPRSALHLPILAPGGFSPAVFPQGTDESDIRSLIEANRELRIKVFFVNCWDEWSIACQCAPYCRDFSPASSLVLCEAVPGFSTHSWRRFSRGRPRGWACVS
jgi:hypothetical protein